jgi:hypothetical protein
MNGKHLLFFLSILLVAGVWVSDAGATVNGYFAVTVSNLGTDSSDAAPDSVYMFWYDQSDLSLDSNTMAPVNTDSLAWWHILVPGTEGWTANYQPAAWAQWYFGTQILRDNALGMVPFTGIIDSARAVAGVTSVDSVRKVYLVDSLDQTVTASVSYSGSGAYSDSIQVLKYADSTALGSGVAVWLTPNGGGTVLKNLTDANGWTMFSADADTYLVTSWAVGYYMETQPDTNEVPATNVKDYIYMVATTPASPSAPGLTSVTFNFKTLLGDSLKNIELQYQLYTKSAQVYHMDSTKIIDYTTVFGARTAASGQVTVNIVPNDSLLIEGNRTGQTWWLFQAYHPETGLPLLGKDGLKLKVPASATGLTWPGDAGSFSE